MKAKLINLGYNNVVMAERVVAVVSASAAPIKRLKEQAIRQNKLVDATSGRKTRAVVVTDSDHIILSALEPETIAQRIEST